MRHLGLALRRQEPELLARRRLARLLRLVLRLLRRHRRRLLLHRVARGEDPLDAARLGRWQLADLGTLAAHEDGLQLVEAQVAQPLSRDYGVWVLVRRRLRGRHLRGRRRRTLSRCHTGVLTPMLGLATVALLAAAAHDRSDQVILVVHGER